MVAPRLHPNEEARRRCSGRLDRDRRLDALAVEVRARRGSTSRSLLDARTLVSGNEPLVMLTLTDVTEQKRVEDQLRALATTDMLTGARTRRHFSHLAELEWVRSARHRHPLCVAFIDVDHFKSVNDRFGHGTGDELALLFPETPRSVNSAHL